jgi:hypothetical protein
MTLKQSKLGGWKPSSEGLGWLRRMMQEVLDGYKGTDPMMYQWIDQQAAKEQQHVEDDKDQVL